MTLDRLHYLLLLCLFCITAFQAAGQEHWTYYGPNQTVYRCFAENDQYLYTGTDFSYGSVQRSTDHGQTWEEIRNGLPQSPPYVNKLVYSDTTLYAGFGDEYGIYYRHDHSNTWVAATLPFPFDIYSLMKAGSPWNALFAGTQWGVIRSEDGIHWDEMNNGLGGYAIHDIILVDSVLFAGSQYGVFTLQPGDTTWESFDEGLPGGETVISLGAHGNKLYAGTVYDGLFVSTDHGAWTSMNDDINIDNMHFNDFAFHESYVFVGTSGGEYKGVFISQDEGLSWTEWLDGFPPITQVLELRISGPYIFAATSMGVFRRFLPSVTGQNEIQQNSNNIYVYPNPSSGHIHFSNLPILNDRPVIQCINQNRQVVYSDRLEKITEENYGECDLSSLPNGMYFLKVTGRDGSWVKKIIIAR